MDQIIVRRNRLPELLSNLIANGAKAQNLTRFITTVSDAILNKIMGFTLKTMGPPPGKFVFMILGSEGRHEQTLKTDQDNAIIFEDVDPENEPAVRGYQYQNPVIDDSVHPGSHRPSTRFHWVS